MYKLSTNSSRLLMSQQTRRLMSTNATVRKSGLSKLTLGALFVTAASMAYYKTTKKTGNVTTEKDHFNSELEEDPFEKTKQTVKYVGRDAIEQGKGKGFVALDELNAAGEHIKRSVSLAGQAAKDSIYSVKDEGQTAVHSFTDESRELKSHLESKVDRFASEHHLKEGNRSPEDVLSHDHHQAHIIIAHDPSASLYDAADRTSGGADKAAFNAANKFKETKETISNDVRRAADFMKEEKDKLVNTARDYNPMVREKNSSDKTKPDWETKLEDHAKDVVHDTSTLVEKDTNKIKEVWNDNTSDMKEKANELKYKAQSKVDGLTGSTKENYGGPAKANTASSSHRGTTLEEKFGQRNVETQDESFWGSLLGSSFSETAKPQKPEKHHTTYDYDTPNRFTANPMVVEKRSPNEKTKPDWETSLEDHAQEYTRDTSTLVDKDTDKVKKGVWNPKIKTNNPNAPIHGENRGVNILHKVEDEAAHVVQEIEQETSSTWSSIFGKSKATKEVAEMKWNEAKSKAQDVKRDASNTWEDAKDRVSSEANRVKRNVVDNVRQAADRADYEKDRFHGNLNDMHKEVSANAEKLKREGEQTAKSWYEKGTEQVRSGFDTVKNVADRDVTWVENKVQDGVQGIKSSINGTKEEMDRILGYRKDEEGGLKGYVHRGERFAEEEEGLLRHTRSNMKRKPASVVVEEAHGRDI